MPREFVDDTDRQTVLRVSTDENILHKQIASRCVRHHAFFEGVEFVLWKVFVDVAPKDFIGTLSFFDDCFVFSGTPGMFAGIYNQCAMVRKNTLATARYFFVKFRGIEVPIDTSGTLDTVIIELIWSML